MMQQVPVQRVLLALVGHNPASAVFTARAYEVDSAILVCTPETQELATTLLKQWGLPGDILCLSALEAAAATRIRARIVDALPTRLQAADELVVDITGGTKLMALAAYAAADDAPCASVQVTYLNRAGDIVDADTGVDLEAEGHLVLEEVVGWYHPDWVMGADWSGNVASVPKALRQREALGCRVLKAFVAGQIKRHAAQNTVELLDQQPMPQLPPHFQQRGQRRVQSLVTGYFSHNLWLEELCLLEAARALRDWPKAGLYMGVHLRSQHEIELDEADVVVTYRNRICVIEAKARAARKGAGADLQKRIEKTQTVFGPQASVVFVHPAWGDVPPSTLDGMAGQRAILIGAKIQELGPAIQRNLGLSTT